MRFYQPFVKVIEFTVEGLELKISKVSQLVEVFMSEAQNDSAIGDDATAEHFFAVPDPNIYDANFEDYDDGLDQWMTELVQEEEAAMVSGTWRPGDENG